MACTEHRKLANAVWALVRAQHGVVARWQLVDLGATRAWIEHRLRIGRLHRTPFRGVYAVGRPELTTDGRWIAAVLAVGPKPARDNRRMQAHLRTGRTAVRFSHNEIRHEAKRVEQTLVELVDRLS